MARLAAKVLPVTFQETPMLLNAPPLLHVLPLKRLSITSTGSERYCESARTAPPPRSGPVGSQRLPVKVELTIRSRPPRSKIAPPPPPSHSWPVELPWVRPSRSIVSCGVAWFWQCDVVHTCLGSHVSR